ncbi:MAG: energy transducer TonB [Gammaproteobacteria bacterium HGW-Gammaproteobacteria-2]|jgi:TonB family protein|nr:MAG: energy transducer TonB [Gammaproteobacteria bacterium HGW-Gammaproteobacteria-2]
MRNDLGVLLLTATVVLSVALLIVLLLRWPVRAAFGARVGYGLWSLPPLAMLALLLPVPIQSIDSPMLAVVRAAPLQALADAPAAWPTSAVWLAIWLLGAVAMMARIGWQQRRFVHGLGPLREAGDGCMQAMIRDGLPALVGIVRPRIVLPVDFATRYNVAQQRLVIAHERAHLCRGDHLSNLVAASLRCVYWFNPLLLVALPLFARDQELACDAVVIAAHPHQRRSYGEALLNTLCQRGSMPLGCQAFGSHPLKERISMIQHHALSKHRIVSGRIAIALLAAVVTSAAWALQPQSTPSTEPAADANASEAVSFRSQEPPAYPPASLQAKEQGTVVLKVRVLVDGTPTDVVIHKSTATPALEQAAINAVQRWRFNPAIKDGKAVEGTVLVPVMFSLDEEVLTDTEALSGS